MAVFGVKDFQLPDWMAEEDDPGECAVLPENWDAVHVFFACGTQWQHGSQDQPLALPYAAVEIVMKRMQVDADDVWWRVLVMESAALVEFRKEFRRLLNQQKR